MRSCTSGFSYWSAIRSLAESSTRIVRYGSPVRSTERTASESMNIARSTSDIRSPASSSLTRRDALPSCQYSQHDQSRAAEKNREDEEPLRPRLLEADLGMVASPGCGRRHAQSIGQILRAVSQYTSNWSDFHPTSLYDRHHGARISTPEPIRAEQEAKQAVKQRAMKLARAGLPSCIFGQLSRVGQIQEVPARDGFGEGCAVELGQIALGRVRVGGERRFERERRADLHLVAPGQVGLLEVELADSARRLAAWSRTDWPLGVTTVTAAPAPVAGNDWSNGWPTRMFRSANRPVEAASRSAA